MNEDCSNVTNIKTKFFSFLSCNVPSTCRSVQRAGCTLTLQQFRFFITVFLNDFFMIYYNIFITFTFLLRSICCPNLLCVKGRITFVSRIAVLFKHPIPAYKHNTAIPAGLSTNQLPISTKPETSPLLEETKPRQS